MTVHLDRPSSEGLGEHLSTCTVALVGSELKIVMSPYSPAQGAMYAPLALKFVSCKRLLCESPTDLLARAPVLQVTANLAPTSGMSSKSHMDAIIGGTIGGVAGLLAIGAIAFSLVRRRRRQRGNLVGSAVSFLRATTNKDMKVTMTVTPYSPVPADEVSLDILPQTDERQQMVERLSSEGVAFIPVGLSDKELAQLRSNASRYEPTDGQQSHFSSAATTDGDTLGGGAAAAGPSPNSQRLRSEVDLLWQEVQQLRAERSEPEAPPTYFSEA